MGLFDDEKYPELEDEYPDIQFKIPKISVPFVIDCVAILIGSLICLFTLISYLPTETWPGELLCHFRIQYIWIPIIPIGWLLFRKHWIPIGIFLVFVCWNIGIVYSYRTSQPEMEMEAPQSIKVLSFNVLSKNYNYDEIISYLNQSDADLIAIQELKPKLAQRLNRELKGYKAAAFPEDGNFGIGLYSRLPFANYQKKEIGEAQLATVDAFVNVNRKRIRVIVTHAMKPSYSKGYHLRNNHIDELANYLQSNDLPTIVIGDFNTTPYSTLFTDFCERTKTRDTRLSYPPASTWPAGSPWYYIPIDHVLVTEQFKSISWTTGDPMGSDHFPILVELEIPSS